MIVIQYLTDIYVNIREHKVHKVLEVPSQTYLKKNAYDSWMNSMYAKQTFLSRITSIREYIILLL